MDYEPYPTVLPAEDFDAAADSHALRAAMKGFGTDEQVIIDILTWRSNSQRQEIKESYEDLFGRDLVDDLKSELSGKFEDVIVALMMPPDEYLCKQLHKAMAGMGTNESILVEILCTKTSEEMEEIVAAYEAKYNCPLAERICSETSGHFRRLLTLIVTGVRDPEGTVDEDEAKEQAAELYAAGEAKLGTDEFIFNSIMSHASFSQLRLIFEEYKHVSGRTIEQAIKHEMSGKLREAMLAVVECVQSPPAFFAKRLYNAMKGAGTDDETLIRICVSRSEIDLGSIIDEFERIYNRTLQSAISSETSGHYKKVLLSLTGQA